MNEAYKGQVSLLLSVLPEIAKEKCFALHGGTAINLFVREMPRLSVDIDLTYLPIEDRLSSLEKIEAALDRIREQVLRVIPSVQIQHQKAVSKLQISIQGLQVKVEVNQINRGVLYEPIEHPLCETAQQQFDAYCTVPVVPFGQLYGGKICAALDRQHPRDLFDVKFLLENGGFTSEIKEGLILSILSSSRPINELLNPNLLDQKLAHENQFTGMTAEPFSYDDFQRTRKKMLREIADLWTKDDKRFFSDLVALKPDWNIYNFEEFPSVQYKLRNLAALKESNFEKYQNYVKVIEKMLEQEK